MPLLQIQHKDGREYNVAEDAFETLYKPFGFKPVGVVYGGASHPYSKGSLEAAREFEKAGGDPNETSLTLEAAARQAEGDEAREALTKRANALSKVELKEAEGETTNPPDMGQSVDPPAATDETVTR